MQENLDELVASLPTAATITNPYPVYAKLRESTPIFGYRDYPPGTVPGSDEPVQSWVLMRHADVVMAAMDHETFSSRDPLQEQSSAPSLMLVNHDNPEHDRLRAFVNPPFAFRQIERIKPWIEQTVQQMLSGLEDGDVEVAEHLTSVLPARVMMRLLGRPDADALQCRDWANAFMLSADLTAEERQASNLGMAQYFMECVAATRAEIDAGREVPEGLISTLLTEESDGERLSIDEVIRFCLTLVVAGAETTTFLLTNLLHNLATMPEIARQLREDSSRILPFINETLRHSGPPQRLFRIATRDVTIGDCTIHEGDWVALFFGAANHDPSVFPDPERFDPSRRNLRDQLSMGTGIHQCLGFAVAKMEASVLIEAVVDSFPGLQPGASAPVPQTASLLTHGFQALTLRFSKAEASA